MKTRLAPSSIEGLGLFADENISAGAIVWKFVPGVDALLASSEIEDLPPAIQEICKRYSYLDNATGKYILCGDDARFVNHSDAPNLIGIYPPGEEQGLDVAARDIVKGEELTCDYRTFDNEFAYKMMHSKKNYLAEAADL